MTELTWHLDRAKQSLDEWYDRRDAYLELAKTFSKIWFFRKSFRECKQNALRCKTLGLVFHDRFKLIIENNS